MQLQDALFQISTQAWCTVGSTIIVASDSSSCADSSILSTLQASCWPQLGLLLMVTCASGKHQEQETATFWKKH